MSKTLSLLARAGPAAIAISSLLLAWQFYAYLSGISPTTLPSPIRVAEQAWVKRRNRLETAKEVKRYLLKVPETHRLHDRLILTLRRSDLEKIRHTLADAGKKATSRQFVA